VSDTSPNLILPYLAAGQAQKHVTVNETIQRLDALVQLAVASATTSAQPASPDDGALYVLPAGKTGADWGAMGDAALAYYRDGAWEEIAPREGWLAFVQDSDQLLFYTGAAWVLFPIGKLLEFSASDKIAGRVSSGAGVAEEVTFTDQAQQLCDDASFQAMCATLGTWRVLAASAVAASHTGDTLEAALATIAIPAGAMGPNGQLRVTTQWTYTNSANAKNLRVRFGGTSGTSFLAQASTTTATAQFQNRIANRGAANSQVGNNNTAYGTSSSAVVTSAVDTSAAVNLVISGQLTNAGEMITLEGYLVELFYGA
jgi:hypothetical protein